METSIEDVLSERLAEVVNKIIVLCQTEKISPIEFLLAASYLNDLMGEELEIGN